MGSHLGCDPLDYAQAGLIHVEEHHLVDVHPGHFLRDGFIHERRTKTATAKNRQSHAAVSSLFATTSLVSSGIATPSGLASVTR